MKKFLSVVVLLTLALLMASCAGGEFVSDKSITVISRESGSGTRSAFSELFGIIEKQSDGTKKDLTVRTAEQTHSTGAMLTNISQNPYAIGYVSVGSLKDTVKAVSIDGVEPTAENVKNGTYKVTRPFNIVTKEELSDVAKDFIKFVLSEDGQKIVEDSGYISIDTDTKYTASNMSGTVRISGSSSVTPVMEKIIEAYRKINKNVTVELQEFDSTTGVNDTVNGKCDIGMASREIKDSELEKGVAPTCIATDGIAVIVSHDNPTENLTTEQVKKIYTGSFTKWSDIAA